MKNYTFNKTDSGYLGKAFEMAIKDTLKRKNADRVSPCGTADFRFNHRNYDSKQNGSVLRYAESSQYIKGSSRVIYATHIAYNIVSETAETISITIDLGNTDLFVFDRYEFIEFLDSIGCIKRNASRGTVNIQTVYNYKKDAYHGRKGKLIEEWGYDHDLDDDIIGEILAGLE
jgi:hypothetical protein